MRPGSDTRVTHLNLIGPFILCSNWPIETCSVDIGTAGNISNKTLKFELAFRRGNARNGQLSLVCAGIILR